MTRLSGEQVTIVQLQGSTESPSQFSSTPWGSSRECFMPIKACTVIFPKAINLFYPKWDIAHLAQYPCLQTYVHRYTNNPKNNNNNNNNYLYLQSSLLLEKEFHLHKPRTRQKLRKSEQLLFLWFPLKSKRFKHQIMAMMMTVKNSFFDDWQSWSLNNKLEISQKNKNNVWKKWASICSQLYL